MTESTWIVQDYCADLLSESENEGFLFALFAHPKGKWVSVNALCADTGISEPPSIGPGADLYVAWLNEPTDLDGYASIMFFSPRELWSTAAIYNQARLLRTAT